MPLPANRAGARKSLTGVPRGTCAGQVEEGGHILLGVRGGLRWGSARKSPRIAPTLTAVVLALTVHSTPSVSLTLAQTCSWSEPNEVMAHRCLRGLSAVPGQARRGGTRRRALAPPWDGALFLAMGPPTNQLQVSEHSNT